MVAPTSGLLRTGLALKFSQIKRAMRSYLRDRTDQATGTATSYAIAAGLFAAAGIFLLAACLVGLAALFRWVEINYGLFPAFGATGGLLVFLALICAAIAAGKLKRRRPHFPTLASRLRVAIKANPIKPDQVEAVRDTAAAILMAPSAPVGRSNRRRHTGFRPLRDSSNMQAGLALTAILLGWAVTRRRYQAHRTEA